MLTREAENVASRMGLDIAVLTDRVDRNVARHITSYGEIPGIKWLIRTATHRGLDLLESKDRRVESYDDLDEAKKTSPCRDKTKLGTETNWLRALEWLAIRQQRTRELIDGVDLGKSPSGGSDLLFFSRWEVASQVVNGVELPETDWELPEQFVELRSLLQSGPDRIAEWWVPWSREEGESIFVEPVSLDLIWREGASELQAAGGPVPMNRLWNRLREQGYLSVKDNSLAKRLSRMKSAVVKSLGSDVAAELLQPHIAFARFVRGFGSDDDDSFRRNS